MRIFGRLILVLPLLLSGLTVFAQEDSKISRTDRGRIRDTKETMRTLAGELRVHEQMRDAYPAELKGLVDLQLREALPKDAWDHDFAYEVSAETGFRLTSYGADGKKGGDLANADIVWTRDGEFREMTTDEKAALEKLRDEARFQAHRAVALREMVVVGAAAVNHRREKGTWPAELKTLRTDAKDDQSKSTDRCFHDPWGNAYTLRLLANENFAIVCWGADGKEGGKERDADFVITEKEVRPSYIRRNRYDGWGYRGRNWDWQANQLVESIKLFQKKVGRLPDELAELTRPGLTKDGAPVAQSIPRDRHGRDYVYLKYGPDEYFVVGLGKDGIQGGTGDDDDTVMPEPGVVERDFEEFEPQPAEDQEALRAEVALEQANDIADKVIAHKAEKSAYPETLETIKAKFPGEVVPLDPWGNAFTYALTKDDKGIATGFTVTSLGRDGAVGGTEVDADITVNEKKEVK